jgi:hypothetical protein
VRRYHKSEKWIRTKLDEHVLPSYVPQPRSMVAVGDATWTGDTWMLVIRDPAKKENVYQKEVIAETTFAYQEARAVLAAQGLRFTAFVGDGRMASPWLFSDILIQMCHFHQEQIVIRYTTLNPELPAGVELLDLTRTLPDADEASFADAFNFWCAKWDGFLKEKSVNPKNGRQAYTHRRLRSARDSIKRHLPYLFTHQKFPELEIPNTTNSLDGSFKKVKAAIGIHAGLTHARKLKLITSLLRKRV